MFAIELSTSMLCARAILGRRSSENAVIRRPRRASPRSAPARNPEAISALPSGKRSSSSGRGFWTLSQRFACARAASAEGATCAPASRSSPSWKPEASPASDSKETSIPALTIFSTVAGTAATLFSPSASSLTTAAFIRRAPCCSPAGDVDVQLIDEELLLVEHEDDHVPHGDDAGDLAVLLDQQVAGVAVAHQVGALALGGMSVDPGKVLAHRLADGHLARASGPEALEDQIALAHQADDRPASLDGDRADPLLRHQFRRVAAGRSGVEADDVADHVPLDGGHCRSFRRERKRREYLRAASLVTSQGVPKARERCASVTTSSTLPIATTAPLPSS